MKKREKSTYIYSGLFCVLKAINRKIYMHYYVWRIWGDYASHNASGPKLLAMVRKQNKNKHIANEKKSFSMYTHHVHTPRVCV